MNDKTEQTVTDGLRCTAAGGRAEIINVPGYPLMVRAVDYNTLRADLDRAIVNFGDAAATVCDMRAQLAEAQRDAEVSKQINRACMELPDDFRIAIELERNSGCVYLLQEGEDIGFDDPCDGIARSISAAIDAAKGKTS